MDKQVEPQESKRTVMYVRLNEYLKNFFEMKYGYDGAYFHEGHPISLILETKLVNNPTLKNLTSFCFCEVAYNYENNMKVTDAKVSIPDASTKNELLAVVIPKSIVRKNGVCQPTGTWQLSEDGVRRFRKEAAREFWMDMELFIAQCFARASVLGERGSREAAIDDFMLAYNIPASHTDSLRRGESRFRAKNYKETENARDRMEIRSGRSFLYT